MLVIGDHFSESKRQRENKLKPSNILKIDHNKIHVLKVQNKTNLETITTAKKVVVVLSGQSKVHIFS